MKHPNSSGRFITLEGPEGSGKTTQIKLLQRYLLERGIQAIATREPGGTKIAEQLRDIVKYHQGEEPMTNEAELLLFAASRAQHVKNLILPSLTAGTWVLCDRFSDSTTAYQGYARRQDLAFIHALNHYATCGCQPDLTLLLDLPEQQSFDRTQRRQVELPFEQDDRIERESKEFHSAVRQGFLRIAEQNPQRVRILDAQSPIPHLHHQIVEIINHAFNLL